MPVRMIKYQLPLIGYRIFLLACLPPPIWTVGREKIKVSTVGDKADLGTWSSTEEGSLGEQLNDSPGPW